MSVLSADIRIVPDAAVERERLVEVRQFFDAEADAVLTRIAELFDAPHVADADVDARVRNLEAEAGVEVVVARRERRDERLDQLPPMSVTLQLGEPSRQRRPGAVVRVVDTDDSRLRASTAG